MTEPNLDRSPSEKFWIGHPARTQPGVGFDSKQHVETLRTQLVRL